MITNVRLLFPLDQFEVSERAKVDASERALNEIVIMMNKKWKVHLLSSRIVRYENLTCDYKMHRVPWVSLPDSILSRALYAVFSIIKSVTIVKRHNLHAIICKGGHLTRGLPAYLASRITNRKYIIRVNEDEVLDIILFIERFRIPVIRNRIFLRMIEKVSRRIENYLFKHVDWIVTHGPMDYEKIRKITAKVTFIPLWVDTEKFRPIPKGQVSRLKKEILKLGNAKVILFVGRLQSDKNLELLLYAFKSLLEVRNDVVLVVIGRGLEEKKYIELVRQLSITDKVKFFGYIRHDEIAKYYNIADVYVLTSIWEELSNTIMEAMACGIPVIATNVGANPYLVKDKETGFLVPLKSPTVLAEKIAYVLDHSNEMKKITSNARLNMRKFTKQDIGELHKKTIVEVIKNKAPSSSFPIQRKS